MPFNVNPLQAETKPQSEDEGGILGNIKGAAEFLNPIKQAPALIAGVGGGLASTAKEVLRAPTTLGGAVMSGGQAEPLEQSPLSFLFNTEYLKNAQNPDLNEAELFRAQLHQVSPLVEAGATGVAETGTRLGAEVASAASRTGKFGDFRTAQQMLNEFAPNAGIETYGTAAGHGQLYPIAVQDILTVAPAARGLGGAVEAAGAEGAGRAITNAANLAERAPLMPYTEPAKAIYAGAQRAAIGETAFPALAQGATTEALPASVAAAEGLPVVGKGLEAARGALAGTVGPLAETAGEAMGKAFRGTAARKEALFQRNLFQAENAPQIQALEADIKEATDPKYRSQLEAAHADLLAEIEAQARNEAKYNIQHAAKTRAASAQGKSRYEVEIPKGFTDADIAKQFEGLDAKKMDIPIIQLTDKITGMWKKGVLPLNPAWQAGNAINNSLTAAVYAGVPVQEFPSYVKRALKEMENPASELGGVLGRGQSAEFVKNAERPGLLGKLDKVTNKAYSLNERVDDAGHMIVALKAMDDLASQGIKGEAAARIATEKANKLMGDFQNMSTAEREGIKRVVPFYAWSKHATKFSLREMMNNPVRAERLATVAHKLIPDQGKGTEFLEGQIPLGGGKFLKLPGGIEQGGTGALESPLVNPKSALGSLNPIIQQIMVAGGVNPRNASKFEGAPGQSMLSTGANYEIQQIPLLKTLADLAERTPAVHGQNVVKNSATRAPVISGNAMMGETKQDIGFLPAPLLKYLTGASIDQPKVEEAAAKTAKREKAKIKATKKFEGILKKNKIKE